MAKYTIEDTTLTAIADAVRAKTGNTELIPVTSLAAEIESIEAGGGGGGSDDILDAYLDRTITEVSSNVTEIGLYAFTYCTKLARMDFPNVTIVKSYAFQYCESLTSVSLPNVKSLGGYAFMSCTALVSVDIPNLLSVSNYAFRKCDALTELDLHETNSIGTFAFYECPNLERLILRKTDKVCTLSSANALQYTKIEDGTGFIYVPDNLVEQYKTAANWSTYAALFRALEDYTVDGTITGELDPAKI